MHQRLQAAAVFSLCQLLAAFRFDCDVCCGSTAKACPCSAPAAKKCNCAPPAVKECACPDARLLLRETGRREGLCLLRQNVCLHRAGGQDMCMCTPGRTPLLPEQKCAAGSAAANVCMLRQELRLLSAGS